MSILLWVSLVVLVLWLVRIGRLSIRVVVESHVKTGRNHSPTDWDALVSVIILLVWWKMVCRLAAIVSRWSCRWGVRCSSR